jgi:hypothetical protein
MKDVLTLVIAAAAVASACGTIYYAAIAHREHAAGRQIFMAVPLIEPEFLKGPDGSEGMRVQIAFTVFGASLPAKNVMATYQPYLDGVAQAVTRIPDQPTLVMPGAVHKMDANVKPAQFLKINTGEVVLEISTTITYDDFYDKPHRYYTKARYDHVNRNFMKLEETLV